MLRSENEAREGEVPPRGQGVVIKRVNQARRLASVPPPMVNQPNSRLLKQIAPWLDLVKAYHPTFPDELVHVINLNVERKPMQQVMVSLNIASKSPALSIALPDALRSTSRLVGPTLQAARNLVRDERGGYRNVTVAREDSNSEKHRRPGAGF